MADHYNETNQEYTDDGDLKSHTVIKQETYEKSPHQILFEGLILTATALISVVIISIVGLGAIGMITGAFLNQVRQNTVEGK